MDKPNSQVSENAAAKPSMFHRRASEIVDGLSELAQRRLTEGVDVFITTRCMHGEERGPLYVVFNLTRDKLVKLHEWALACEDVGLVEAAGDLELLNYKRGKVDVVAWEPITSRNGLHWRGEMDDGDGHCSSDFVVLGELHHALQSDGRRPALDSSVSQFGDALLVDGLDTQALAELVSADFPELAALDRERTMASTIDASIDSAAEPPHGQGRQRPSL